MADLDVSFFSGDRYPIQVKTSNLYDLYYRTVSTVPLFLGHPV